MTFQVGDHTYNAERIPAREQFHIVRRLAPFIGELAPVVGALKTGGIDAGMSALKPLGDALASMSDADADYVLFGLLRHSKRQIPGGAGWAAVCVGETINHLDINMVHMVQIAANVFRHNLSDFMGALPSDLLSAIQK